MKVLVVGATGAIGSIVLTHCLAHPKITSVVAFCRRPLPDHVASNKKLQCFIVGDFKSWPEETLKAHSDASAMLWMIGTHDGSRVVNFDYPMTFQTSFARALKAYQDNPHFRYIYLSGGLVEQDQNKTLFFYNDSRKIRGELEIKTMELAKQHNDMWKAFIVRPAGVVLPTMWAGPLLSLVMGKRMSIRADELAAYMTHLATGGDEHDGIIYNPYIVNRGRGLLQAQTGETSGSA